MNASLETMKILIVITVSVTMCSVHKKFVIIFLHAILIVSFF